MSRDLRPAVVRAVEEYNRYRSPEAVARILHVGEESFELEFSGPFCQSCGVQDYFEDMVYELENLSGIRARLVSVRENENGTYRARYSIGLS